MSSTTTKSGINQLSLVCVTSTDQDRSIQFYEQLGFEKRVDLPFGGAYRWVEIYLAKSATGIALAPPPQDQDSPGGAQTGITLTTEDIDSTHAHLKSLGVDVDDEVSRMGDPVPPMFWFRDPDANTLMIVEQT